MQQGETPDGSNVQWTRHPQLYFEEGMVVLLAGTIIFRVYMGLLSMHSEVFDGMFSLSTHQPPGAETYDTCPLVRLSDAPEDLGYFLNALIDITYFPGNEQQIAFPKIAAILRLSTKYMVQPLRQRAIAHLARAFPERLDGTKGSLDPRKDQAWRVFGAEEPLPHPFMLVSLFRECRVDKLLPFAFYAACEKGLDVIMSGDSDDIRLSHGDTRIVVLGWEALRKEDARITLDVFEAPADTCSKGACNWRQRATLLRYNLLLGEGVSPSGAMPCSTRVLEPACSACRALWENLETIKIQKIWDKLPGYFNLPSWEELRRQE